MKIFILITSLVILVFAEENNLDESWWKTAVFYQIYPRSFKDSDGDGVGDLKGIMSKLQHLKDSGITGTWLSPIFASPQDDFGYDIKDFTDIHEEYGTLSDFDELVKKADELGIKIVLDFVPNHSSNQHDWFIKSANREKGYENYYIWHEGKLDENGKRSPPNNWLSVFNGSAWTWHDGRKEYYYHQFFPQQPDLNYREPAVVEEMKEVLRFWLKRGAAGFRVDAIPHLFEVEDLRDEPIIGSDLDKWKSLNHTYTMHLPETYDIVQGWRDVMDEYAIQTDNISRVMMTEAYGPMSISIKYYESGASFSFNFGFVPLDAKSKVDEYVDLINNWLNSLPEKYTHNWVIGNHDNSRVASRFGVDFVDGINMIPAILPGISVTYNGEEIGMEDGYVPPEMAKDHRDPERTPFQWDSSPNAGFTEGTPWLPVSEKYKEVNLELQSRPGVDSHYHVYQELNKARKTPTLLHGSTSVKKHSDNTFTILRELDGEDSYVMVFNIGNNDETIDLTQAEPAIPNQLKVLISSVGAQKKKGENINAAELKIAAHEAYVLTGSPQK